ncbi:MAG TPA: transposase, partial [Blastocatellia bacterium]|nr:transposase [Blastocatellia bacterium]
MANSKDTTIKTFEFKLRISKQFVDAAERELEHSRQIYNAALAERISCYKITGVSLGYNEQSRHLTEARELPEVKRHLRTIQRDALERVEEAFNGFFRRVKNGEKPGFPRFKGQDRYRTFSQKYEKVRPCPIKGDKLTVPGVGSCRVRLSRLIEGQSKQLRITRRVDGWYALIVCESPKHEALPPTGRSVGVDVGISSFATLSNGEEIENPRHLESALDNLQRQQRRLSRRQKGSKRRAKQRIKVAKAHLKVSRCRKDFQHKVSTDLVRRFDTITVEDLNIRGMVKNRRLARAISDVAWGSFFRMTKGKAENAGRRFERVDPRYTSQNCSKCGQRQKMPLAVRVYECGKCGAVIGRDH